MATTETIVNGNGTQTEFVFSFPYLKIEDVKVELQEYDATQSQIISRLDVTAFTIPNNNPTVVQFNAVTANNYQTATGAPRANHAVNTSNIIRVRIYRFTNVDTTPATFASGSAIRAKDLNDNFERTLYALQEGVANANDSYTIAINALPRVGGTMTGPIVFSSNQEGLGTEVGSTPPLNPSEGDTWWDSVSGKTYVYYNDGDSSQWVDAYPEGVSIGDSNYTYPTGITRTISDRLQDTVSVKDFGAVGDGVTDDTAAIQAAVDNVTETHIYFPKGTYKITAPINLKSNITIEGGGREHTLIQASGNFPILQHVGGPTNTVGDVTIRSVQIRGQANTNDKQFGIFCDWGSLWVIEDCSFRLCKIGYFQGTSRNNVITNCDFILCDTAMWFGPIDQSGGGTPDNTVFMDTIDAVATVDIGLRVEGLTGCKAVNCSFVNGNRGVYVGNYVRATTPRAILDGSTANVPLEADARQIRWMHLTNIYTDSVSQEGWVFDNVTTGKATTQVKLVNCWGGNHQATNGMSFSSCENIQIAGSTMIKSIGRGIYFDSCTDVQISNLACIDFDRADAGLPGIELNACNNVVLCNITGEAPNSTLQSSTYLVKLTNSTNASISGLVCNGSRLVNVVNSVRTIVSDSFCLAIAPPVVESGTSNSTVLSSVIGVQQPTLIGNISYQNFTGTTTAPRIAIVGGSTTQPALYINGSSNSGFYRSGTHGIAYTANGTSRFEISDARFLMDTSLLGNFVDDAAANSGGVAVGQLYRTGSIIKVRVS